MNDALPTGWADALLGDICVKRVFQAPPTEHPVPYIDISSIDRTTKRIGETKLVSDTDAPTRARQWVQAGDVLVSMTRPNLNAVAQIHENLDGAVASTGFDVLRPVGVLPEWVFYRVRTNEFVADVCEDLQGVVYPAIRPHDVRRHKLPLPPEGEQRRIVEAIESYFTRLDDAAATMERVQRNLKRYRASVLKAAVEGRLVPTEAELARAEGRDYEPASVLLDRILAERRRRWEDAELAKMTAKSKPPKDDKWKAKYKEPDGFDPQELPLVPEGWSWVRAEQVCEFITKGTTPKAELMSQGTGDVPYIKVYNLTFDGTLDFSVDPTFVDFATHRGFLARSVVFPGDLLTNIVGPPLGKVSLVPSTYPEWNINQAIARFRPLNGLFANYLALVLGSATFLQWAKSRSKATAGQFNLTLEICRHAPIPLPPASEQARIVEEAARITDLARHVHESCRDNQVRCARLRQAILKWAFDGRLVDQDPTDEPASRLVERIRAEREFTNVSPPRRRRRPRARSPKA